MDSDMEEAVAKRPGPKVPIAPVGGPGPEAPVADGSSATDSDDADLVYDQTVAPQILIVLFLIYLFDNIIQ
jgi:hypothetical protein